MSYSTLQNAIHRAMIFDPPEPPHDPPLQEWSSTKRAWTAQITANGKRHYLGQFTSVDDARAAYIAAKKRLHSWAGAA